jgi:hypothetical protein
MTSDRREGWNQRDDRKNYVGLYVLYSLYVTHFIYCRMKYHKYLRHVPFKGAKCEIFFLFYSRNLYTRKPLWIGDTGTERKY